MPTEAVCEETINPRSSPAVDVYDESNLDSISLRDEDQVVACPQRLVRTRYSVRDSSRGTHIRNTKALRLPNPLIDLSYLLDNALAVRHQVDRARDLPPLYPTTGHDGAAVSDR